MAGGKERILRGRIRSIQSTKKITKAMELIAASQIVKAQGRIAAGRPYQEGIARVVVEAAIGDPVAAGRLLGEPERVESEIVLVVVADRGLCGGYNTSVLRATERLIAEGTEQGIDQKVVTAGKKAQSYFSFRRQEVAHAFSGFSEKPTFADAREIAGAVVPAFVAGEVDRVRIVSTRFRSAGSQYVEVRQLLPLVDPRDAEGDGGEGGEGALPPVRSGFTEFEPDAATLLESLAPIAAETAIYAALLEAAASEVTARQRAMAAATENAEELIKKYTRIMNRARQDTITTEIMEIVGGAEALRAGAAGEEAGPLIQLGA